MQGEIGLFQLRTVGLFQLRRGRVSMSSMSKQASTGEGTPKRAASPISERLFEAAVVIPTLILLSWYSYRAISQLGPERRFELVLWVL